MNAATHMQTIQMVDLQSQYLRIKPEIDKAMVDTIESGAFINGPAVKSFQQNLADYLHVNHAIGCGNGTDALQIALMALDLQPGDEVITTPFTFVATAEVIALLGLRIVFVDADPDTFNLDVTQLEAAITPRTRCIIPVHLFGQPANMQGVMDIARKHNLYVVEDNAQAIGAECYVDGKTLKTGGIGHIGTLSFYPSKNLSCYGDGGAMTTNNNELYHKLHQIANHGSEVRYYHNRVGVNSRLDTVQAAVLNIKLEHLNEYTQARQHAADYYDEGLKGLAEVQTPARAAYGTHVFHQYTIKAQRRDELAAYLKEQGIPTMIYYPVPLHLQAAYKSGEFAEGSLPVSEKLCKEVLSLPMHTELNQEQLDYILFHLTKFYQKP